MYQIARVYLLLRLYRTHKRCLGVIGVLLIGMWVYGMMMDDFVSIAGQKIGSVLVLLKWSGLFIATVGSVSCLRTIFRNKPLDPDSPPKSPECRRRAEMIGSRPLRNRTEHIIEKYRPQ